MILINRLIDWVNQAAEWKAGQKNPHVPVNEGIGVALLLHLTFKGKDTTAPPGSPEEGEAHILGASPSGDWSTFSQDNIAYYYNGSWREMAAVNNLTADVDDGSGGTERWRYVSGTGWVAVDYGDPNVLKKNATATLTAGYTNSVSDQGTKSGGSWQPSVANGHHQKILNGGAFTLTPPASGSSILLKITNNASAGAITTSGFTKITGDSFTTTDGDKFACNLDTIDGEKLLHVRALQ